jgi:hypothetical protein
MAIEKKPTELIDADGQTWKYYLFAYKEGDRWEDGDRSDFQVNKHNDPNKVAEDLYYYKVSSDWWEVYLFVNGKPVHLSSFDEKVKAHEQKLEEARKAYKAKLDAAEKERQAQLAKEREEYDKREWARLKAKFGSGQ